MIQRSTSNSLWSIPAFFQHKLQNLDCMLSERHCNICRQTIDSFYTHEVKMHVANHLLPREYYCTHCDRLEKASIIEQYEHLLDVLGDTFQICAMCGETMNEIDDVWQHINDHHPEAEGIAKQNLVDMKRIGPPTNKYVLCNLCGLFVLPACVGDHICKPFQIYASKKERGSGTGNKEAQAQPDTAPFECEYCKRMYRSRQTFFDHMNRNHRNIRSPGEFPCRYCQLAFAFRRVRDIHELLHRTYDCILCGQKFKVHKDLSTHLKIDHPERKDATEIWLTTTPNKACNVQRCEKCNTYFPTKQALQLHSNSHSDTKFEPVNALPSIAGGQQPGLMDHIEKPNSDGNSKQKILLLKPVKFKCKQCLKTFKKELACVQHKIEVHNKKFRCARCGLLTDNIVLHMQYHRVCFLCKIDFESVAGLKEHQRVKHGMHTGQ